jgi:hypothetical protein
VDGSTVYTVPAESGFPGFGVRLEAIGDVDGDATIDFVASTISTPGSNGRGRVYVLSGKTGSQIGHLDGMIDGGLLGTENLRRVGDVDGDGAGDFVATSHLSLDGESGTDGSTSIVLISGRTVLPLYWFKVFNSGYSGAVPLGDVDGDGFDDLLVDSPKVGYDPHHPGDPPAGAVFAYRGNDLFLNISPTEAAAKATVVMTVRPGVPGNPLLYAVERLNGSKLYMPLALETFDSTGTFSTSGVIPPGLSGNAIALRCYAIDGNRKLIASSLEWITFN